MSRPLPGVADGVVVGDVVLAHHPLVTAVPFVVPAVVLAVLFVGLLLRGRWERAQEQAGADTPEDAAAATADPTPAGARS